jgi:hypothetical protein
MCVPGTQAVLSVTLGLLGQFMHVTVRAYDMASRHPPALSTLNACKLDVLASTLNCFGATLFDELRTWQGLAYSVAGEHGCCRHPCHLSSAVLIATLGQLV